MAKDQIPAPLCVCERIDQFLQVGFVQKIDLFGLQAFRASQVELVVKNPSASAGDTRYVGLIPGSGRSPGEGNCNLFQYSCLGNPKDRGAYQATVHGVAKESDMTQLLNNSSNKGDYQSIEVRVALLAITPSYALG